MSTETKAPASNGTDTINWEVRNILEEVTFEINRISGTLITIYNGAPETPLNHLQNALWLVQHSVDAVGETIQECIKTDRK